MKIKLVIIIVVLSTINWEIKAQKRIILENLSGTVNIIDADNYDYNPGDTIVILEGTYAAGFRFIGFNGEPNKPIIVINQGQVIIKPSTTNYAGLEFRECNYLRITGSGQDGIEYGIQIDGSKKSWGVNFYLCSDIEVDHIEIFDTSFAGIMAKADPNCENPITWRRNGYIFKNLIIHHNLIYRTHGEGIYIGYSGGAAVSSKASCNGEYVFGHWLENVLIYKNIVRNTGWDGIQASLVRKNGRVFENIVYNYGMDAPSAHSNGIVVTTGQYRVYNNYVEKSPEYVNESGGNGINIISAFGPSYFYGNVVKNASSYGIWAHNRLEFESVNQGYYFFNNTILNTNSAGILYNACIVKSEDENLIGYCQENVESGFYNNLIINPGIDYRNNNFWKGLNESFIDFNKKEQRNGVIDYISNNMFTYNGDTLGLINSENNFRISSESSPLYNSGYDVSSFNYTLDMDSVIRPTGGYYDIGAYEYGVSSTYNSPPIVTMEEDIFLELPIDSIVINCTAYDIDGIIQEYQWDIIEGSDATIKSMGENAIIKNIAEGVYKIRVTVIDNDGLSSSDELLINILAQSEQQKPLIELGNDLYFDLPQSVITISANVSDADGEIIKYYWEILEQDLVIFSMEGTGALQVFDLPDGEYIIRLTVTDNNGNIVFDEVNVVVSPESRNAPPIVDAGTTENITLPINEVTLKGTATDPDGNIVSYLWEQISGPPVIINTPTEKNTTVSNLVAGSYIFRITVTDNDGALASDEVIVTVIDENGNVPPSAFAGEDLEYEYPSPIIVLIGEYSDDDGEIVDSFWRYLQGPIGSLSDVNSDTLTLENLQPGIYLFEFVVTDNDGAIASDDIQITIHNPQTIELSISKYFSPDGNGINDEWVIDNLNDIPECQVTIYSRFGQLVYESANYQNNWDGTLNGNPLPEADYYYILKSPGLSSPVTGGVRIIRDR